MKIICIGLSRTGTKSLASALRILGFTVHDNREHIHYHLDEYCEAIDGKMPNFYAMYKDVDAVIACPVYMYWKELRETFPNAKIILMERDSAKSWAKSFLMMKIAAFASMASFWNRLGILFTPTGRKWKRLYDDSDYWFKITRFRFQLFLGNDKLSEEMEKSVCQVYNDHNSRVKAAIPKNDLLVYNVKQGWKPLCAFLGVDVPDAPFPRLNAGQNLHPLLSESLIGHPKVLLELVLIIAVLVAFAGFVIYRL